MDWERLPYKAVKSLNVKKKTKREKRITKNEKQTNFTLLSKSKFAVRVNPGKYGQGVNTDRWLTIHMSRTQVCDKEFKSKKKHQLSAF